MRKLATSLAAVAAAVLLTAGPAGAQQPNPIEITSVDAAGYPTVAAVVTAAAGYPSDAFEVLEDGEPVPFTAEPIASDSLEIMLVIDTSGSMLGAPIDGARGAVSEFLAALPLDVRVGIVGFSSQPVLVAAPTTDRSHLAAQVAGLAARGETALNDAVIFSTAQFTPAATDRAVVVLSDGGDTASAASLDQAVAAASGHRVHVIELVSDESNRAALERLAAAGDGTVLSSSDPAALGSLYRDAASALLGQYQVQYESAAHGSTSLTVRVSTPNGVQEASTVTNLPATASTPPATPSPSPSPAGDAADAAGLEPGLVVLLVGGAGVFLALVVLVLVGFSGDRRGRRARRQLGVSRNVADSPGISHLADRMTAAADGYLDRHNQRRTLANALEVGGISLRPGEFVVMTGIATLVFGMVGLMLFGIVGLVALAVLVPLGARVLVGRRASSRRAKFEAALPDVIQLLTSALRSGYGLLQALDSVAQEAAEPARSEFRRVLLEVRVGRDLGAALRALSDRMRSQDFEWVVGAIDISREVGGDLATVLDNTAGTIRERQRVFRQIKTLSAEGRISAYILIALPILVAGAFAVLNPDYFALLTSGLGLALVIAGALLLGVGWLWLKKLIRIEY